MSGESRKMLLLAAAVALAAAPSVVGLYDTPRVPQRRQQQPIDLGRNRAKAEAALRKAEEKRRRRDLNRLRERLLAEERARPFGDKMAPQNWITEPDGETKMRPEVAERYQASCMRQLTAWIKGISIHNREFNECCPDGSCCLGDRVAWSNAERQQFVTACVNEDHATIVAMLEQRDLLKYA
jgi:hypothetical protein